MVEKCVADIVPTIRETIWDVISGQSSFTSQPQSSQENPEFNSSTFQVITGTSTDAGNFTSPQSHEPGFVRPVGLGVEPKIKANILANEFVIFATLLSKSPFEVDEIFKSIKKNGQLIFVKTNEAVQIKSITTWLQAFHLFVAIYCLKHPS